MTSSSLYDTTGTLPDDGIVLMDHIRECVELAAQVRSAAPLQLVGHCLRSPLTREAPGGDGGLLQRPPPALLTTDTFIPAHNTTTCTMRPLGKAAAASGKAADGTRPGVHCGVWEGRRRRSSRAPHAT